MQNSFDFTADSPGPRVIPLQDAEILLFESCFPTDEADLFLQRLIENTDWRQDSLNFGGRAVPVPRLQAWIGDPDSGYAYSGLNLDPRPWTPELLDIRARVEALSGSKFNAVLLNYYRDGRDSVAWHSDDEAELGDDPVVASVSFGASRRFQLKHKQGRHSGRVDCELPHGSLLVMGKGVQKHWYHQVPKQPEVRAARVNLTFRRILQQEPA